MKNFLKKLIEPSSIGIIGIVLTILGTIVPSLYITNAPISFIYNDGKFVVIFMLVTLLLLIKNKAGLSLIPTILACFVFGVFMTNTAPNKAMEAQLFEIAKYGPGCYMMLIGLCLCLYYGMTGRNVGTKKEPVTFRGKYFVIGLILPIIGFYLAIINKHNDKEKMHNYLLGASIGTLIFLFTVLIFGLM